MDQTSTVVEEHLAALSAKEALGHEDPFRFTWHNTYVKAKCLAPYRGSMVEAEIITLGRKFVTVRLSSGSVGRREYSVLRRIGGKIKQIALSRKA